MVETVILRQRLTKACHLFSTVADSQEEQNIRQQVLSFPACKDLGYSWSPESLSVVWQVSAFHLWNADLCVARAVSVPVYAQYVGTGNTEQCLSSYTAWEMDRKAVEVREDSSWDLDRLYLSPLRIYPCEADGCLATDSSEQQLALTWVGVNENFVEFFFFFFFPEVQLYLFQKCVSKSLFQS